MRHLSLFAVTFALLLTVGCRRQQSDETGGVSDTARTPAAVPAAEPTDTTTDIQDFSFDQRQEFAQSIRRQLGDIDQQIADLAAQAKSRGGAVSDRALASIRGARRTVDRNLSRVEAATTANWEQVKQGINQSIESLGESIDMAQPK